MGTTDRHFKTPSSACPQNQAVKQDLKRVQVQAGSVTFMVGWDTGIPELPWERLEKLVVLASPPPVHPVRDVNG